MVDTSLIEHYVKANSQSTGSEQYIVKCCTTKINLLQDSVRFFLLSGDIPANIANKLAALIIHEVSAIWDDTSLDDISTFVRDKQTELYSLYTMLTSIYDKTDALDILEVIINGKI